MILITSYNYIYCRWGYKLKPTYNWGGHPVLKTEFLCMWCWVFALFVEHTYNSAKSKQKSF